MKKVFLPISIIGVLCTINAMADLQCLIYYQQTTCSGSGGVTYGDATNASSYNTFCYKECNMDYGCENSVALRFINVTACTSGEVVSKQRQVAITPTCEEVARIYGSCCDPVITYGSWEFDSVSSQKRTVSKDLCGTTTSWTEYRCRKGYYSETGKASSTVSASDLSCTKCSLATGITSATTADGGATAITQCYVPAGTALTDDKGTYTYSSDCYYSN